MASPSTHHYLQPSALGLRCSASLCPCLRFHSESAATDLHYGISIDILVVLWKMRTLVNIGSALQYCSSSKCTLLLTRSRMEVCSPGSWVLNGAYVTGINSLQPSTWPSVLPSEAWGTGWGEVQGNYSKFPTVRLTQRQLFSVHWRCPSV